MTVKQSVKTSYRVLRTILFSAVAFVVAIYALIYILLSIPPVQHKIRDIASVELSKLTGGAVCIGDVDIRPFNEVIVSDVSLSDPEGKECISIEKLGAGISMWNLVAHRDIIVTYVELLGADVKLWKSTPESPVNIQFLIDALSSKEKSKEPPKFCIHAHSITIRKSRFSFDKCWVAEQKDSHTVDFNHLKVANINADIDVPVFGTYYGEIDLRRLAFELQPGLKVEKLATKLKVNLNRGHDSVMLSDITLQFPNSLITIEPDTPAIELSPKGGFGEYLANNEFGLTINIPQLTPADFAAFKPGLDALNHPARFSCTVRGNSRKITVGKLDFKMPSDKISLDCQSLTVSLQKDTNSSLPLSYVGLEELSLQLQPQGVETLLKGLAPDASHAASRWLAGIGNTTLKAGKIFFDAEKLWCGADLVLDSGCGKLELNADMDSDWKNRNIYLTASTQGFDLGGLLGNAAISSIAFDIDSEISLNESLLLRREAPEGANSEKYILRKESLRNPLALVSALDLQCSMPFVNFRGEQLNDCNITCNKSGNEWTVAVNSDDDDFDLTLNAGAVLPPGTFGNSYSVISQGIRGNAKVLLPAETPSLTLNADIRRCRPGVFADIPKLQGMEISGILSTSLQGSDLDNITGTVSLSNLQLYDNLSDKQLALKALTLTSKILTSGIDATEESVRESKGAQINDGEIAPTPERLITLESDWLDMDISGRFTPTAIPQVCRNILASALPDFITPSKETAGSSSEKENLKFSITIPPTETLSQFFRLPVQLLYPARITGAFDSDTERIDCHLTAPYILQGRDKLISGLQLDASATEGSAGADLKVTYPTKKGDLDLDVSLHANAHDVWADIAFNPVKKGDFYGQLKVSADFTTVAGSLAKQIDVRMHPTDLYLKGACWNIGDARVTVLDKNISVRNFSISHGRQYINISGVASPSHEDKVTVLLQDINLDYIFDTLNINYVTFGGQATGEAYATGLLSGSPVAETRYLHVKNLSYNHALLGDGKLHGDWDNARKRIGITADVSEGGRHTALIDGGIWLGRDSLSFDIDASRVRADFVGAFMKAFASDVHGRASGHCKLYGTFKDVDLTGRLLADSLGLKINYTDVRYHAMGDSLIIDPGMIKIPPLRIYDAYGHHATLSGWLRHRYFHEPTFEFKVSDARDMLLYDTNPLINPVWFGRIFASGNGKITGFPDKVLLEADMTTDPKSTFTFALSDRQNASDYNFVTFTDRRKEAEERWRREHNRTDTDDILEQFRKRINNTHGSETGFAMDIRATITPGAEINLVLDPASGDKITARGNGALNLTYETPSDEMHMYGKYTLDEGTYKFTLQDLIIKDFIIKSGSSISFNGDPMAGLLDIRAAYRVNTNLTDLDKSFSTDRDLNRTNVPVDAMLLVKGEMEHPEISFDIELPTLNDEVTQKVRSVISSEDMMSRQMLYLLALNRFYTPEYMANGNSGGEWASVASSTLSSQLSNILGQMTDKFSVAPSLRSDKGDFSDLEVDLALSSRLFNNRLLINGNFGYRDRSTSSTTFIGDFDVEYLLNRNGNFRLKAYNHFNDQNYYLKSALTTQGIGVLWRKDFGTIQTNRKREKDAGAGKSPGKDAKSGKNGNEKAKSNKDEEEITISVSEEVKK